MGGAPPPPLGFAPPVRKSRPFRAGFRGGGQSPEGGGGAETTTQTSVPVGTVSPATEGEGPEGRQARGVIGSRSLENSPTGSDASRGQRTALLGGMTWAHPIIGSGRTPIRQSCHPPIDHHHAMRSTSIDDDHHHRIDHPTTIINVDGHDIQRRSSSSHRSTSIRPERSGFQSG